MKLRRSVALVLAAGSLTPGCGDVGAPPEPVAPRETVVLTGAGDIATCFNDNDAATASLLDAIDGFVFAAGDNLHDNADGATYENCYEPTWGRHRDRTYAAPGNHDYDPGSLDPNSDYFGERGGPRGLGYYSVNLGAWHIVFLNSNADRVATGVGSAQEQWLREDLAAHRTSYRCTLAIFHQPRFYHGDWG
jgi:hypothetical protein